MARPSVSTTGGDDGTTGLFGGGRVAKTSERIHAYGTVDELNALVGLVLAEDDLPHSLREPLVSVQRDLFTIGADLATPQGREGGHVLRLSAEAVQRLEEQGSALEQQLTPLERFVLPGGSRTAALLHHARTVCRRAERWTVHLQEQAALNEQTLVYLNRLSDYLFLAARFVNQEAEIEEEEWKGREEKNEL